MPCRTHVTWQRRTASAPSASRITSRPTTEPASSPTTRARFSPKRTARTRPFSSRLSIARPPAASARGWAFSGTGAPTSTPPSPPTTGRPGTGNQPRGTCRRSAVGISRSPSALLPIEGARDGLFPSPEEALASRRLHRRRELAIERPVVRHVVGPVPIADRQARKIGGAERRGFGDNGPPDRHVEDVGLELQQG